MMTSRKMGFAGLALAAATMLTACGGPSQPAAKTEPSAAPTVEVVVAGAGADGGRLRATGMVSYQREATLSFRTAGLIREILVDDGDQVRAGQVLARLDLNDLNASVAEAELALRNADQQLTRDRTLMDRGFIAQARLDASELGRARAQAALTAVRFNREQAVITAPGAGVILRRLAEPNQNAAPGAPILLFGSKTQGLLVRAGVSEEALRFIRLGDKADVRLSDNAFHPGRVTRIGAKSDTVTAAFDVEITLDEARAVRSGQVAEVLIATQAGQSLKVKVPTTALLDARADQGVLYVVDAGGKVARRSVRTAGVEGEDVVIADGLASGERVVVAGAAFIRDGQTVTAVERKNAP